MFAPEDAGNAGRNWFKFAAYLGRGIRFRIPHIEMAGAAVEEKDDAGIGGGSGLAGGVGAKQPGQVEAEHRRGPDLDHAAPRHPRTGARPVHQRIPYRKMLHFPLLSAIRKSKASTPRFG